MTSARVTSFLMVAVTSLWMTMSVAVTTAQVLSLMMSWTVIGGTDHFGPTAAATAEDEGVCRTRYLSSSANGTATGEEVSVVSIAAVLELRRPEGGGCGSVSPMELQTVAALFWAVRRLNDDRTSPGPGLGLGPYIPGMRLELRVYDDCSHDVLDARHVGQLLSVHPDFNCTPATPPLAGFLGTTTSHSTSFVAGLLSSTKIPHFGTSATVSVLSNSTTYPTFYRTVPSDVTQSKVLVELVQRLQWTYVVGIYTRDNYGMEGFQEFKRLATLAGVCVFKEKSFWHSDQGVQDSMERFIRELLIELGNTRFSSLGVVYFGHDTEATILFKMIQDRRSRWHNKEKINNLYWLVSDGVGRSLTIASLVEPYTVLSISPATSNLQDIMDFFFQSLDKPEDLGPYWQTLATEYLEEVQGCLEKTSPVTTCQLRGNIETYDYLPAVLDSFYSLAALLGRAHQKACGSGGGGASSPGVCTNMSDALKQGLLTLVQPEAMNYSKHFSPERLPLHFRQDRMLVVDGFGDFMPANSPLYFINFASKGQWTKIGEYCNGSLTFQSQPNSPQLTSIPRSECGSDCPQCRKQDGVIRYAYRPGEVLLLGLYSVSSSASSGSSPSFACGDYRKQSSSVVALLAFLQSVEEAERGEGGGGGGGRFGALVLDDCYNKLTASVLLTDLFSGKTTLRDPSSGEVIDMKKVVAVIGSQSSSVTLSALSLLTPLHIPTISYSATSPDLDDRLSYPFFLRPVPSDSLQARALVDLVRWMNITYVGALHQNNNYGWRGIQTFVSRAQEVGVCVEKPVPVDAGDSSVDLHEALRNIRSKDAKVVVVFLVEPTVLKLLDAIRDQNLDLIFLASEAWTLSTNTLSNHRGMTSRGSLVLTVDTSREAGNIKMVDYLQQLKTPALATQGGLPWMRDFWENEKQCNLPGGFTNSHSAMCGPDLRLGEAKVKELAGDQKVVQTINSVASVTAALQQQCASHSDPVACMLALSAAQRTNVIRSVQLQDQKKQSFRPYLSNGNGNVGFTVHNVQKAASGTYSYVQVGHYHPEQGLQLHSKIVFYNPVGQPLTTPISSTCLYKLQCRSVCGQSSGTTPLPPVTPTPSPLTEGEGGRAGLVAAVVVLALACVALVAVLVVGVCCAKRRGYIPFLGIVRKRQAILRGRMGGGQMEGETNLSFMPTSPRASQPLPPVPRSSIEGPDHYTDPADLDSIRRYSESSGNSSSIRAVSPALYGEDRSLYDHAEDEGGQRRLRNQFRPQPQHLRGQLQEAGHSSRQMQRLQSSSATEMVAAAAAAGQNRPRARSVPRVDRPGYLPVQGLQQRGSSGNPQGVPQRSGVRPRSNSHDAAFRARLGALSDDEQQILLKYMKIFRQQSRSPQQPPHECAMLPLASTGIAEESDRPIFFVQPEQAAETPQTRAEELASPNPVFETPPPFCSSRRMNLGEGPEDDPSLLYLHAIPNVKDLYLELLSDASERSPPAHTSLPPSHSPALSSAVNSPSSSSPAAVSSPVRPAAGNKETSPRTRFGSPAVLVPVTSRPSPTSVTSPLIPTSPLSLTSPLTSARGSLASESSGAVFVSPDQEFPPQLLKYSPKNVSPNDAIVTLPAGSSPTPHPVSRPQFMPVAVHEENRAAPGAVPLLSSPSASLRPLLISGALQHQQHQQQGSRVFLDGAASPLSPAASPVRSPPSQQTSPLQSTAADFPGVVVRDSTGAVFWLPGVMVPPASQNFSPVSSLSAVAAAAASPSPSPSPPSSAVVFPQGAGLLSPQQLQFQRGDLASVSAGHVTTPMCTTQQTSVTLTPACTATQQAPVTFSPTYPKQTLTPAQTPMTPACGQQTPTTTLTPVFGQQQQTVQPRSKMPRMGVDSLSAQRKQSDVTPPHHNSDSELFRATASNDPLQRESTDDTPGRFTWVRSLSIHPGSPQRSQSSELLANIPPTLLLQDGTLSLEEQNVASPSPCKTLDSPEVTGSGGSNETSGDSGTGEDLNQDHMDLRNEVCV